jgi:hypothetical protein
MEFNHLLVHRGVDPKHVLIMRHAPRHAKKLYDALPKFASEQPGTFNAYQQSQMEREEKMLTRAKYLASFVWCEPGKAKFVGLYEVHGSSPVGRHEFDQKPGIKTLRALGMEDDNGRWPVLWFDLKPVKKFEDLKLKLLIKWEGGEKAFCRWADRNQFKIIQSNGSIHNSPPSDKSQPSRKITEPEFYDVQAQLASTEQLDTERKVVVRKEQAMLRKHLFGSQKHAECFVCGEEFPIELLVAAHIKPRSECSENEKRDLNNIVPMCLFGCDALFERRQVVVSDGKVELRLSGNDLNKRLSEFLKVLQQRQIPCKAEQAKYFDWHSKRASDLS